MVVANTKCSSRRKRSKTNKTNRESVNYKRGSSSMTTKLKKLDARRVRLTRTRSKGSFRRTKQVAAATRKRRPRSLVLKRRRISKTS